MNTRVPAIRALLVFGLFLCLFTLPGGAQAVTTGASLQHYTSIIDGSLQQYGLYLPNAYTPGQPCPVIFIGHGFGGRATSSFSTFQQEFANLNGFILVQADGRGNTFYDGPGEVDLYEILADLRARYTIDENRLYFEGASMGATGAYRLGIRHPDLFAAVGGADGWGDYRYWYPHWYGPTRNRYEVPAFRLPNLEMASCMDLAENARWLSIYMIVDTNDTTVWPDNTYSLNDRLDTLSLATGGYDHEMETYPGGHCGGYNQETLYNYFLTKTKNPSPAEVTIKTKRLKYGKLYWAAIDRLHTQNEFATLTATVTGNDIAVTTENVLQFTLNPDDTLVSAASPLTIAVNGLPNLTADAWPVTVYAVQDASGAITGWSLTNPFPNVLRKTAALEGPIGDAYNAKFIVVYGTSGTSANTTANKAEADAFCQNWNAWMHASIVSRPDTSVTAADIADCNLILFGTSQSNAIIQSIQPQLPIEVTNTSVSYEGRQYQGTNFGAYFIYPNPLNWERYVVINHLSIPGARPKDLEALPWYWPDYVIFDTNKSAGDCVQSSLAYLPDSFVEAGYFDSNWSRTTLLPQARYQPDLQIRTVGSGGYIGVGIYNTAGQVSSQTAVTGIPAVYEILLRNDGNATDTVTLTGSANGSGMTARYLDASTGAVLNGVTGWTVTLGAGETNAYRLEVTLDATVAGGASRTAILTAVSQGNATALDVVHTSTTKAALSAANLSVAPATSATVNTPVTLTATAVGGGSIQYRFRTGVKNSRGQITWTTVRNWASGNLYTWTPKSAGTYSIAVDAREVNTTATVTKELAGYQVKAKLSKVTLKVSPTILTEGGTANLTATATGGSNLEYQFLAKNGTGLWVVIRDWSPVPTVMGWQPRAGSYALAVNAREQGNPPGVSVRGTASCLVRAARKVVSGSFWTIRR